MDHAAVSAQRLRNQHITGTRGKTARDVVSALGAMQAQDYLGALWAVGLRVRDATEADIERALAERQIVRTWPLRGTLHFVAAEDVRWMLALLGPRMLKRHAARLERDHGLDPATVKRSRTVIERALRDGRPLTRPALYQVLERNRISTAGQRGLHLLWRLAHDALICFGSRQGKQPTLVLLDDWLPPTPPKPRDEALAELARRYFTSHGPATLADFIWWSSLSPADAKRAMEIASLPKPRSARPTPAVHLLPPFDELIVAYRDRTALLDPSEAKRVNAGGGMIPAVVIAGGRVVGSWKRVLRGDTVEVTTSLFRGLEGREGRALGEAVERYARFLGKRGAVVRE